jgi:hypothetical protein
METAADLALFRAERDALAFLGASFLALSAYGREHIKGAPAANALALADALQASPNDLPAALARWEPPQVALGKYLRQQGSQIGDYLLFHRSPVAKIG